MKADLYSLTASMMHIADHPSDPWLDENLRANGLTPYKYGEFKGLSKGIKKGDLIMVVGSATPTKAKSGDEFGVNQDLLNYLADKVKE